eukprot:CAMPEP_0185271608 /NCGR_PEP_ID=MMETSP1359-20130426/45173_1 /TAXON_ID=552665 /ORGANISM="Bigelowiella longifila, Strain CCMP242" /LENGTH=53 /DNA_ID=CAMNT_0027863599 /DNA_START=200 /DNA_END=361 /DNA_ORIENTATION=-
MVNSSADDEGDVLTAARDDGDDDDVERLEGVEPKVGGWFESLGGCFNAATDHV